MRRTRQLSFTLPNELAEAVKANVATGEYATESEVIRDGLRTLMARSSHRELAKGSSRGLRRAQKEAIAGAHAGSGTGTARRGAQKIEKEASPEIAFE